MTDKLKPHEIDERLIRKIFSTIGIVSLGLQAACAHPRPTISLTPEALVPPAGLVTLPSPNTPKPTEKSTETPTPIATATTTEPPTPTETPRMTLEDWKKVFSGSYTGPDGFTYDLGNMFGENVTILTDPDQVKTLPLGTTMTILNPDGSIIVYSDTDVAAERVEKGAIILIDNESPTPKLCAIFALQAAAQQFQKGNKNIYVLFNENSVGKFPFNGRYGVSLNLNQKVFQMTLDDGTIITPIMAMPKHFDVRHSRHSASEAIEDPVTLEQAGIIITNPDNWLDQVLKAGYDTIVIYPW